MRVAIVVGLVALATLAEAAPRVARGVVLVGNSPVAGATILTEHGDVAATDADGYFTLTLDPRDHAVTIVAQGYITRTVEVVDEDTMHVDLEKAHGAEVIEVYGRAPEETKPLSYQLTADEIRAIPGAFNDVLRATQVLPGVARIPYSFGGLVLRGSSPRDTEVYLDGVEVPLAFHFGGVTSFYPSNMLSDLSLTAGGFDASHGRAQGGLVELTTKEARRDRWRVGGEIGLLDSGAFAEGPLLGGGITIGVRRSYFDTVAGPFVSSDTPLPSYWDFQLRTSWGDPRDQGRITPMIFGSIDRVASNELALTSAFVRIAAPYTRQWGPLTLHLVPYVGINQLSFEEAEGGGVNDTFSRPQYPGGVRADLTRDYPWGHVAGGVEASGGHLARTQVNTTGLDEGSPTTNGSTTATWVDVAAWAETRIKIDGERFAIKPGLRLEHYGLSDEWTIDPRLNIHEQLSDTITLRQSIGRYHQPTTPADVDPSDGNKELESSYIDQLSLGLDKQFESGTSASLTGYYDYGQNLGVRVTPPTQNGIMGQSPEPNYGGLGPTFELLLEKQLGFPIYRGNVGRARAYGLEVLVKRSIGKLFLLASYTLSRSERTDDPAGTRLPNTMKVLPSLGWRPFELDQTHNLNLAAAYAFANWKFGARLQVVSGNPYSPQSFDLVTHMGVYDAWGGNLPTFVSLDLRADRRWHRCWGDIDLFFDIQNATNHDNVEGRDFSSSTLRETDVSGLPIIPFIGVEFIPK